MANKQNPREVFLTGRQHARDGNIIYDGDRFPISFSRDVQVRIEKLAAEWRVPRAEIVRYLVAASLTKVEAMPLPTDQEGKK